MLPLAASTLIRVIIPTLAAVGGILGGAAGAIVALVKLMPERASLVVGYQGAALEDLAAENERLWKRVGELELRLKAIEDDPRAHLA